MARDPYRASTGDLGRGGGERWDRERFMFERDRDRYGDERSRYEEDDRFYRGPPRDYDRRPRAFDDDVVIRDSRRVYYDDEPRYSRRPPGESDVDRRVVIERERERVHSPSPPRRPGTLLRRQSSLDTFDRRPRGYYEREEYGPPARREDFRPPTYTPIPLPRTKALPPPRRFAEREYYDEIKVSDPDYYGDDDYRPYPERVREKEIIKTRRRDRSPASRTSRGRSHRGSVRSSSRSSSTSSRSSSSSGGTTVKSEYPKKGKTRIPRRLVSERALIDLGYPFVEEGNVIVVLKALGQENIDDLLKLSEDYKKAEMQMSAPRGPPPGGYIEERREDIYVGPPPPPQPPMMTPAQYQQPSYQQQPPPPPPGPPVEVVNQTTVIRDVSPARSYTTTTSATPYIVDARPVEISEPMPVGPLALVTSDDRRHRSRSRSEIRSEIKDLERQLARSRVSGRDIVKAERLSDGQLVLYEEKIEKIEEPHRGVRIEKDKKGPPPNLVRAMLATLT